MEQPNDSNNNPFLRKELERGKSKADVSFEDGPDNKRARTLQSVASLQVLARRALPALTEVPEAVSYGVDRAYPGRPPPVKIIDVTMGTNIHYEQFGYRRGGKLSATWHDSDESRFYSGNNYYTIGSWPSTGEGESWP